jgi:hypothetical protein
MVEYQHRAEGGGNDVRLDNTTWEHGELVLIVPKTEMLALLFRSQELITAMMPGVRHIALQNYRELNDVQVDLAQIIRQIKVL